MLWVYCVCFENRCRNYDSSVLILKITVILVFALFGFIMIDLSAKL